MSRRIRGTKTARPYQTVGGGLFVAPCRYESTGNSIYAYRLRRG